MRARQLVLISHLSKVLWKCRLMFINCTKFALILHNQLTSAAVVLEGGCVRSGRGLSRCVKYSPTLLEAVNVIRYSARYSISGHH